MDDKDYPHGRWLNERFEHINTILNHVKDAVDKVREDQSRFIQRCECEMYSVGNRIREIERRQDEMTGARMNLDESQNRQNLTWQMLIALGTAFSAIAAIAGYFVGKV